MILDISAALRAELCFGGVVVVALCALHRRLSAQFLEQRLAVLQVGGVEALDEPAVDLSQHRACLIGAIGVALVRHLPVTFRKRRTPFSSRPAPARAGSSRDTTRRTRVPLGRSDEIRSSSRSA